MRVRKARNLQSPLRSSGYRSEDENVCFPPRFLHSAEPKILPHNLIQLALLTLLVLSSAQTYLAQSLETERVQYPNAQVAFICGPQLKAGSALNPAPWFDSIAYTRGITLGDQFPRVAPFGPMSLNSQSGAWGNVIAGRINITAIVRL